jgi:uncharacterized protein YdhG (YjbR/CyaY superfamily)
MKEYKTVDEYMKDVHKDHLPVMREVRSLVRKLIPKGEETIRYGMPTIQLHGKNFIHYAAMKGHLGLYPTPSGVKVFEKDLKKLGISFSKGCIRFSYDKVIPTQLITEIIKFRLQEEKGE